MIVAYKHKYTRSNISVVGIGQNVGRFKILPSVTTGANL